LTIGKLRSRQMTPKRRMALCQTQRLPNTLARPPTTLCLTTLRQRLPQPTLRQPLP
jgi:hypothetical protein